MQEIEFELMQKVIEMEKVSHGYVHVPEIAKKMGMQCLMTLDILKMMSEEGFVHLEHIGSGLYGVRAASRGRLMVSNPDYMRKKGYVIGYLKEIEEAINATEEILPGDKANMTEKLRGVITTLAPYAANIGSTLISTYLQKQMGM